MNNYDCFGNYGKRKTDCENCDCIEACQFAQMEQKQSEKMERGLVRGYISLN